MQARGKVRLWCAAAATGEEPYTIAITLLDAFEGQKADIRILATDISTKALNAAIAGHYSAAAVDALSAAQRAKYFEKSGSKATGATYTVRPEVKQLVLFRRLNLSTPPFPMRGSMDIVFCRNVMIYFDTNTRQGLISEIERLLVPGGDSVYGSLRDPGEHQDRFHRRPALGLPQARRRRIRSWRIVMSEPAYRARRQAENIVVGVADMQVSDDPNSVLVTYALGSCIALCLYDPQLQAAGMIHYMLPMSSVSPEKAAANPAMFADTGVPLLFERMFALGCQRDSLVVKAVGGGALNGDSDLFQIGQAQPYRAPQAPVEEPDHDRRRGCGWLQVAHRQAVPARR